MVEVTLPPKYQSSAIKNINDYDADFISREIGIAT